MNVLTILLLTSSVVAEPFIKSCGNFSQRLFKSRDELLDFRNHWRTIIMKAANVSNMFELKYNPNLEDEIRKMNSCEDIDHGTNYRVGHKNNGEIMKLVRKYIEKMNSLEAEKIYTSVGEVLHPGQTFLAWCDLNVNCSSEYVDDKNQKQTFETDQILILGPKGTYSESDFKIGKPGADCPNGVVTAPCKWNCDLCKGPEVPVKTTTPSKEVEAGDSKDADSAAPFVSVVLILSISLTMYFI